MSHKPKSQTCIYTCITYKCIFHLHYQRHCTYYVNTVNNITHQCVFIYNSISITLSLLSALLVASVHHCIIYLYIAVFTTNLRSHQCTYNRFTVTSVRHSHWWEPPKVSFLSKMIFEAVPASDTSLHKFHLHHCIYSQFSCGHISVLTIGLWSHQYLTAFTPTSLYMYLHPKYGHFSAVTPVSASIQSYMGAFTVTQVHLPTNVFDQVSTGLCS